MDFYGKLDLNSSKISLDIKSDFNFSGNTSTFEPYIPHTERLETYLVPIVFAIIFLVGVAGNGTLIFFIIRYPQMRNLSNTYILSLAVGDLLVIVLCVPFVSIIYTTQSWPFGENVCRLQEAIKDLSLSVTVITLTVLSAERYFAIVNLVNRQADSNKKAIVPTAIIWIVSAFLAIPGGVFSTVRHFPTSDGSQIAVCIPFPSWLGDLYPKINVLFKMVFLYALPLIIISFFYILMARHLLMTAAALPGEALHQQYRINQMTTRRKVAKMVLAFVFIFAICFLPNHVFLIWFYFNPSAKDDFNYFWNAFRILGFCLTFINSCINPVALYCISSTFRRYFNHHLFCDLCGTMTYEYSGYRFHYHSSRIPSRIENINMSPLNGAHKVKINCPE